MARMSLMNYIELTLHYEDDKRLLIPVNSIVAIQEGKDWNSTYSTVFIKDLHLYTDKKHRRDPSLPPYAGVEAIAVSNDYQSLSFLLQGAPEEDPKA